MGADSIYFSLPITQIIKSAKIKTNNTAGNNIANSTPTDFSYKYLALFTPSVCFVPRNDNSPLAVTS